MDQASRAGMRVVHVVGDGIFAPVLESQVLAPLRALGDASPQLQRAVVFLTSVRHLGRGTVRRREEEIRRAIPGVEPRFRYRLMGGVPFENQLWASELRRSLGGSRFEGEEPIILHCRGAAAAAAAAVLRRSDPRVRILLDLRGLQHDEVALTGWVGRYLRRQAERRLRGALACADAINTVSHRMSQYLGSSGWLPAGVPRSVVGSCVDADRFCFDESVRAARRRELGVDGAFVLCYCGAASHWQCPDAVAETYAALRRTMGDVHLLILTRAPEAFQGPLRRAGVTAAHVTIRSARHDEVASYLMAADVGLLLRENTLTNRVAAPVKFAEYLACGVPVMLTPHVGDLATFAVRWGVGRTVSHPVVTSETVAAVHALRESLATDGNAYRAHCSRVARRELSWRVGAASLLDIYATIGVPRGATR